MQRRPSMPPKASGLDLVEHVGDFSSGARMSAGVSEDPKLARRHCLGTWRRAQRLTHPLGNREAVTVCDATDLVKRHVVERYLSLMWHGRECVVVLRLSQSHVIG